MPPNPKTKGIVEDSARSLLAYYIAPLMTISIGVIITLCLFLIFIQLNVRDKAKELEQEANYWLLRANDYLSTTEKTLSLLDYGESCEDFISKKSQIFFDVLGLRAYPLYSQRICNSIDEAKSHSDRIPSASLANIEAGVSAGYFAIEKGIIFYRNEGGAMATFILAWDQLLRQLSNGQTYNIYLYGSHFDYSYFSQEDRSFYNVLLDSSRRSHVLIEALFPYAVVRKDESLNISFVFLPDQKNFIRVVNPFVWFILLSGLLITGLLSYLVFVESIKSRLISEKASRLSKAIIRTEVRYAKLMEVCIDALLIADKDGFIKDYNPSALKLFETSAEDLAGSKIASVIPALESENTVYKECEKTGRFIVDAEAVSLLGREFPVSISVSKIEQDGDELYNYLVRDITERKEMEESLTSINQELKNFGKILAHDLKAPVRSIASFSELLRKPESRANDDAFKKNLDFLIDATRHIDALVDALSQYSNIKESSLDFQILDLAAVFEVVRTNLSNIIEQRQASILIRETASVNGNKALLVQLFQNLIANGIKYCQQTHPEITVTVTLQNQAVCVAVKDNGIGFDEKYAEKIFMPFERLHGVGEYEGTGLGLATCKKIADLHQAKITCESKKGEGSVFYVYFPFYEK